MTAAKPNIIFVYADDLGRGMLSCYGQKWFKTPNLDRLADEGLRFTSGYGCSFCAPARASLLTGYHDCHMGRWSYTTGGPYKQISEGRPYSEVRELINSTSFEEREDEVFLATIAKQAGYVTGEIGKLEWGFSTTPERLRKHGWDYHYGYYDHQRCHGFYPPFLFDDGEMFEIPGNTRANCGATPGRESDENRVLRYDMTGKAVYSQDLFDEKIVEFIEANRDKPFLLYHPSQLPHGPISIPEIHPSLRDVDGLTDFEKEYASMVLRLDETVGKILDTLERCGIDDNTAVFFTSDNGHETYYRQAGRCSGRGADLAGRAFDNMDHKFYSERCGDVFNGNDGMAGCKLSSLEGGARIPYLVRWPETVEAGTVCDIPVANYDVLPTLAEMVCGECPAWKDGISYLPALRGKPLQRPRDHIVFAGTEGPALVTTAGWKVRYLISQRRFELFFLPDDYREEHDLAAAEPDRVRVLGQRLLKECDGDFRHGTADNHKAMTIEQYLDGAAPEDTFPAHPHTAPIREAFD